MDIGNLQQLFPELDVVFSNKVEAWKYKGVELYSPIHDRWEKYFDDMTIPFYPAKEYKNIEGVVRACCLNPVMGVTLVYETSDQLVSLFRWHNTNKEELSFIEI